MAYKARVLLLGDSFVGKTSISNYISKGVFNKFSKPTCACGFIVIHVDETLDIQLWDTAGMERYRSLNKIYFRGASGAVLVFDFTSKSSFNNISSWRNDFLNGNALDKAALFLVGNKHDCVTNSENNSSEDQGENNTKKMVQEVSEEEAANYAKENGMTYFAVSALTGEGINELVQSIGMKIPRGRVKSEELKVQENEEEKKCC